MKVIQQDKATWVEVPRGVLSLRNFIKHRAEGNLILIDGVCYRRINPFQTDPQFAYDYIGWFAAPSRFLVYLSL